MQNNKNYLYVCSKVNSIKRFTNKKTNPKHFYLCLDPKEQFINDNKDIKIISPTDYTKRNFHFEWAEISIKKIDDAKKGLETLLANTRYKRSLLTSIIFKFQFFVYKSSYFYLLITRMVKDNDIDVVIFQNHTFLGSESRNLISYFKKTFRNELGIEIIIQNDYFLDTKKLKGFFGLLIKKVIFNVSLNLTKTINHFLSFLNANNRVIAISDDSYGIESAIDAKNKPKLKKIYLRKTKFKVRDLLGIFNSEATTLFIPTIEDYITDSSNSQKNKKSEINLNFNFLNKQEEGFLLFLMHEYKNIFLAYESYSLNILKAFNVASFVSQQGHGLYSIFSEICQEKKLKTIFVNHGSQIPNPENLASKLWEIQSEVHINACFEYKLLQSYFDLIYLNQTNHFESKKLWSGPLIKCLKNVSEIKNDQLIFLFASTPKQLDNCRPLIYETFDEYIFKLKMLCEYFVSKENLSLQIRHRESDYLSNKDLENILKMPNNVSISKSMSFKEDLSRCDYLISYSSTCIEEALISKKKVILFDINDQYQHLNNSFFNELIIENKHNFAYFHINNSNQIDNIIAQDNNPKRVKPINFNMNSEVFDNFY